MRIFPAVSLLCLTLALAVSTPAVASADTLHMQTPWVALSSSQDPFKICYVRCEEETGSIWDVTCPAGYTFALAPDARTSPVIEVWEPNAYPGHGATEAVQVPYWWSGSRLYIHAWYYDNEDLSERRQAPDGTPVPPFPHIWAQPQDYLCEKGASSARAARTAAAAVPGDQHETVVRQIVRTVAVPKRGRRIRTRLHCPAGEKLLNSSSSIATFRRKRPAKNDHKLLELKHHHLTHHAFVDASASRKLAKSHRIKVQMRVSCQVSAY